MYNCKHYSGRPYLFALKRHSCIKKLMSQITQLSTIAENKKVPIIIHIIMKLLYIT